MRHAAALEAVRQEFVDGLTERGAAMRAALGELDRGFAAGPAEALYMRAHALTGTAAAFGALELVPHASALADRSRRWVERGTATAADVAEAHRELRHLLEAMAHYRASLGARDG